jgi:hypothetical protein
VAGLTGLVAVPITFVLIRRKELALAVAKSLSKEESTDVVLATD